MNELRHHGAARSALRPGDPSRKSRTPDAERNLILVGTSATNPKVAELGQKGLVKLPTHAQGYTIACLKSPWQARARLIVVAGTGPSGVLYGVREFNKKLATLFPITGLWDRKRGMTV